MPMLSDSVLPPLPSPPLPLSQLPLPPLSPSLWLSFPSDEPPLRAGVLQREALLYLRCFPAGLLHATKQLTPRDQDSMASPKSWLSGPAVPVAFEANVVFCCRGRSPRLVFLEPSCAPQQKMFGSKVYYVYLQDRTPFAFWSGERIFA